MTTKSATQGSFLSLEWAGKLSERWACGSCGAMNSHTVRVLLGFLSVWKDGKLTKLQTRTNTNWTWRIRPNISKQFQNGDIQPRHTDQTSVFVYNKGHCLQKLFKCIAEKKSLSLRLVLYLFSGGGGGHCSRDARAEEEQIVVLTHTANGCEVLTSTYCSQRFPGNNQLHIQHSPQPVWGS